MKRIKTRWMCRRQNRQAMRKTHDTASCGEGGLQRTESCQARMDHGVILVKVFMRMRLEWRDGHHGQMDII